MTRRNMIRVLLSLLLLISQQMAFSHVITHWSGQRGAAAGHVVRGDGSVSDAFAKDQVCSQCLAFAQIAGAVGNTPRSFAPPAVPSGAISPAPEHSIDARIVVAFRSRAPPGAV
jgi:hypothetical protein